MAKLDRLVWAATSTYRIGPFHIGVRSSSERLDETIRRALEAYYVGDVEAPPNFSVVVPDQDEVGAARGLNMLYEGHTNLVRSRHPERVLRALFQHLGKYIPPEPNGHVRVSDLALVRDGRAILVPRGIVTWMDLLAPRLNRAGWQFVDLPWSSIDLNTAELVVHPPPLTVSDHWEKEIFPINTGREPAHVAPGRYRLSGWGVYAESEQVMSRLSGAAAVAAKVLNPGDLGAKATLDGMVDLVGRIPVSGLGSPFEGDFAARLISVDAA